MDVQGDASEPTPAGGARRVAGEYRLERRIGRGAMGEVWLARHGQTGGIAAVKLLRDDSARGRERLKRFFDRERRAVARLDHPNVVPLFEVGPDYIVTRYIEGATLSRRLAAPIEPDVAIDITLQIASALAHAHANHVIHRDVKPSNILLDSRNNAYLSDFGLAALVDERDPGAAEDRGGTPQYMAPEQARAEPAGPLADQYSLGRVLAEMLAGGRVPADPDQAIAALPKTLPDAVLQIVRRAIDKDPARRWPSLDELSRALAALDLASVPAPRRLLPEIRVKAAFAWAAAFDRQRVLSPTISQADYRLSALEAARVISPAAAARFRERTGYADFGWSVIGRADRLGAITDPAAYARAGELAVMLHGGLCTREIWTSVAAQVAHGNAQTLVLVPDLAGYGASVYGRLPRVEQVTAKGNFDGVLEWLELLGVRELPMVLVGHSLGATTLLAAADDELGPRTSRVALAPLIPAVDRRLRWGLSVLPPMLLALGWIPGAKRLLARLAFSWSPQARVYSVEERRAMIDNFLRLPLRTLVRTARAYARARTPSGDKLARCIAILADNDPVAPLERTLRSLRSIGFPEANIHRVVAEGHMPQGRVHMHPEWTARNVHEITMIIEQLLIVAREGSVLPTHVASTLVSTGDGTSGLAEGSTEVP